MEKVLRFQAIILLEGDGRIMTEYLIVPFVGACIHVPAPTTKPNYFWSAIHKRYLPLSHGIL